MSPLFDSRKGRLPGHAGRPRRTAEEFAASFFHDSRAELSAAQAVFASLQRMSPYDLSGLEPDDRLADILPFPDSSRRAEAVMNVMGLDPVKEPSKRATVRDVVELQYWQALLDTLLGPARTVCTWDAETLPHRSV